MPAVRKIFLFILAAVLGIAALLFIFPNFRPGKQITPAKAGEKLKAWNYWVEITGENGNPIFQGKIIKITRESFCLGIGVLNEESVTPDLIGRIKNSGVRMEYPDFSKLLGKFKIDLKSFNQSRACADEELQKKITPHLPATDTIQVKLVLSAGEIRMPEQAGLKQFDADWEKYSWEP